MEIKIQSIHFDATEKLQAFIEKKVAKLEKTYMSESSYSAMVDALLSFVFCGTQSAVSRYMNI